MSSSRNKEYENIEVGNNIDISITTFTTHLRQLLEVPISERSPEMLKRIVMCSRFLNFFKDMEQLDPDNIYASRSKCCRLLEFKRFKKGSMILKYKSNPENFFINLKGNLGVYVPLKTSKIYRVQEEIKLIRARKEFKNLDNISFEQISRLSSRLKPEHPLYDSLMKWMSISEDEVVYSDGYLNILTGGLSRKDIDPNSNMFDSKRFNLFMFEFVATIETGTMFGELGLVFNRPRAATILALDDVEVACLNKQNFQEVYGQLLRKEQLEKYKFFNNFVIKSEEFRYLANTLMIMFRREYFQKGDIIVKQGDRLKKLIVIYSGDLSLQKSTQVDQSTLPNLAIQRKSENETSKIFMNKPKRNFQTVLAVLCKGEMIGEEYLLGSNAFKGFDYSVVAQTSGIMYTLERFKLDQVFDTNMEIRKLFEKKQELRLELLKKMNIIMEESQSFKESYKQELENINIKRRGPNYSNMTSQQIEKNQLLKKMSQRVKKEDSPKFYLSSEKVKKSNLKRSKTTRDLSLQIINTIRMQKLSVKKADERKKRIRNSLFLGKQKKAKQFDIQDIVSSRMKSIARSRGLVKTSRHLRYSRNSKLKEKLSKISQGVLLSRFDGSKGVFMTKALSGISRNESLPKILTRKGIDESIFGSSKAFKKKSRRCESLDLRQISGRSSLQKVVGGSEFRSESKDRVIHRRVNVNKKRGNWANFSVNLIAFNK